MADREALPTTTNSRERGKLMQWQVHYCMKMQHNTRLEEKKRKIKGLN